MDSWSNFISTFLAIICLFIAGQCKLFAVLQGIVLCIAIFIFYLIVKFSYWWRKNVPSDSSGFPFGYMRDILTRKRHHSSVFTNIYNRYPKEKYVGIYRFHLPGLLIRDPDMIKAILITNYEDFTSRGMMLDKKVDIYSYSILSMDGNDPKWKDLRSKAVESLSTSKIKTNIFNVMLQSADDLNTYLNKCSETKTQVELKSIASKYALDVIGAAAFGVQCKSFEEAYNPYKEISIQVLAPKSLARHIQMMASFLVPELMQLLRRPYCSRHVTDFFTYLHDSMLEQRRNELVLRSDWMTGMLNNQPSLSKEELVGNMIAMMAAGYESSASMISFAFYLLAIHPDIQEKARIEVNTAVAKHGGFTYDAILDMKYVEAIIDETIRLFPPVPTLIRKCTKDCMLPNTKVVVEKETRIIFPTQAILRDPSIFPDPEKFHPGREMSQVGRTLLNMLPFGAGPRACPGKRYSMLEGRVSVAKVLYRFRLLKSDKTPLHMELDTGSLSATSKYPQLVIVEELESI